MNPMSVSLGFSSWKVGIPQKSHFYISAWRGTIWVAKQQFLNEEEGMDLKYQFINSPVSTV
jgi:hypothetical protein